MDCLNSFGKVALLEIAAIFGVEGCEEIQDLVARGLEGEQLEKVKTFIEYASTLDLRDEDIPLYNSLYNLI